MGAVDKLPGAEAGLDELGSKQDSTADSTGERTARPSSTGSFFAAGTLVPTYMLLFVNSLTCQRIRGRL